VPENEQVDAKVKKIEEKPVIRVSPVVFSQEKNIELDG